MAAASSSSSGDAIQKRFAYGGRYLTDPRTGTWYDSLTAKLLASPVQMISWSRHGATVSYERGASVGEVARRVLRSVCNVCINSDGDGDAVGEVPLAALREEGDVSAIVAKHGCTAAETNNGAKLHITAPDAASADAVAIALLELSPFVIEEDTMVAMMLC